MTIRSCRLFQMFCHPNAATRVNALKAAILVTPMLNIHFSKEFRYA